MSIITVLQIILGSFVIFGCLYSIYSDRKMMHDLEVKAANSDYHDTIDD